MSASALVAVGTGLIGSDLVKQLINSSETSKVIVMVGKCCSLQMKGIDILEEDFDLLKDYETHMKAD